MLAIVHLEELDQLSFRFVRVLVHPDRFPFLREWTFPRNGTDCSILGRISLSKSRVEEGYFILPCGVSTVQESLLRNRKFLVASGK